MLVSRINLHMLNVGLFALDCVNSLRAFTSIPTYLSLYLTSTQPPKCSDGLECSKRSGGNLHMRCWTATDIAEQEAGENMDAPPPAPSVAFPPFPPVSMPTFPVPVPMPTFPVPVPLPTFPTNAIDPNNCAGEGGRAQQCGASANRAPMCCEGFVCTPGNAKVSHRSVHRYCGGINRVNNATSLLGCPSDLYA